MTLYPIEQYCLLLSLKFWEQFAPNLHFLLPIYNAPFLMVLYGTNLVSNISTIAPIKHHIQCPICTFLVQIKCKFNVHFCWERGFLNFWLKILLIYDFHSNINPNDKIGEESILTLKIFDFTIFGLRLFFCDIHIYIHTLSIKTVKGLIQKSAQLQNIYEQQNVKYKVVCLHISCWILFENFWQIFNLRIWQIRPIFNVPNWKKLNQI